MTEAITCAIEFLWEKMFILMQNIFIVPAMENLYKPELQAASSGRALPRLKDDVFSLEHATRGRRLKLSSDYQR